MWALRRSGALGFAPGSRSARTARSREPSDPVDEAQLYTPLRLALTYRRQKRLVEATITPSLRLGKGFVSEET